MASLAEAAGLSAWTAGGNVGTIETAIASPAIERAYCERDWPGDCRGYAIMLWLLRVMGLLIAATLACAAAHTARAEPPPADACGRATFRVIIDVGHTAKVPGATLRTIAGADHGVPLGWSDELNASAVGFIRAARR